MLRMVKTTRTAWEVFAVADSVAPRPHRLRSASSARMRVSFRWCLPAGTPFVLAASGAGTPLPKHTPGGCPHHPPTPAPWQRWRPGCCRDDVAQGGSGRLAVVKLSQTHEHVGAALETIKPAGAGLIDEPDELTSVTAPTGREPPHLGCWRRAH